MLNTENARLPGPREKRKSSFSIAGVAVDDIALKRKPAAYCLLLAALLLDGPALHGQILARLLSKHCQARSMKRALIRNQDDWMKVRTSVINVMKSNNLLSKIRPMHDAEKTYSVKSDQSENWIAYTRLDEINW